MSLALIRLLLGNAFSKAAAWLSHRSFWQIMFGAALLVAGVQTMRLWSEQRHARKVEEQLSKTTAELNRISSTRNTQKQTTGENIKVVTRVIHDADQKARAVESAPPAPDCRTKPEVLDADL